MIIVLAVGFPVALMLAWVYELRGEEPAVGAELRITAQLITAEEDTRRL